MAIRRPVARIFEPGTSMQPLLDQLPVGAYLCDAAGLITYFNARAEAMWGRAPLLNSPEDRWCGSHRLYLPDGQRIRHDQCWMARAILEDRAYIGQEIVVERPDGTRLQGLAHASPLHDERGHVIGAVNVVVNVSDRHVSAEVHSRLAAIVENSHDAIISKTLDGRITSWNLGAQRLFGYEADEIIGQPVTTLIPPDRRPEEAEIIERLSRGERIESYETQRRRKDGSLVEVSLTISPLRDAAGRVTGASKIARDIGARKISDTAIRASEQRYRSLVEASGALVFHADAAAHWNDPNPAWEAYTGQSAAQSRGHGWLQAVHPEDRARVESGATEAIARGLSFAAEGRIWHAPSQNWRYQEARAVPIRDAQGTVTAWVGTCLDVHGRREAEEALRAADRRKDEFLAVMAHELRNPLAPLTNSLDLLRISDPPAAQKEHLLAVVHRQVGTLVRLVDDLMEASRIGRGLVELKLESVPLSAAIDSAVETSRPLLEARNHALELDLDESLKVHGDRTRLVQIIGNLVNNAAKYTPRGGKIRVTARRAGALAELRVTDSGCGIPPDMLSRIFDMFTQIDTSPERTQGGLGIGLSIVKRLVELHEGTIEAMSLGRNQGSEFVVRLPLGAVVPAGASAPVMPPMPPRRRVLIADDNVDAANSLALLLRAMDQEVTVVHNGADAVAQTRALKPNLLLLDIGMPGMNGYDVARSIRAQAEGRLPLIVAMTGWGQDEDRRRSHEAGFDEHLVKPATLGVLTRVLTQARAE